MQSSQCNGNDAMRNGIIVVSQRVAVDGRLWCNVMDDGYCCDDDDDDDAGDDVVVAVDGVRLRIDSVTKWSPFLWKTLVLTLFFTFSFLFFFYNSITYFIIYINIYITYNISYT